VLGCCGKGIGVFNCFAASMGVAQVGLQWGCFAVMSVFYHHPFSRYLEALIIGRLALFLIYFPRANPLEPAAPSSGLPSHKVAVAVTVAAVLHFVAMAAASFYLSLLHSQSSTGDPNSPSPPSDVLVKWANFLGLQSMVVASLQYIPQLYTTWKLKHVGSLSIPMMCIQTPGSFVWAASLAFRQGTKWSSWATYVCTGVLQGALLAMCIVWELKERAQRKKGEPDIVPGDGAATEPAEQDGERQPLLANGH
jgi:uncharacterized protein with PQ loop repeat